MQKLRVNSIAEEEFLAMDYLMAAQLAMMLHQIEETQSREEFDKFWASNQQLYYRILQDLSNIYRDDAKHYVAKKNRHLFRANFDTYVKVCNHFKIEPWIRQTDIEVIYMRKQYQRGRKLIKDQENLVWMNSEYFQKILSKWVPTDDSARDFPALITEVKKPREEDALLTSYKQKYASEVMLEDSDDDGTTTGAQYKRTSAALERNPQSDPENEAKKMIARYQKVG
jgi:hypothetical protein